MRHALNKYRWVYSIKARNCLLRLSPIRRVNSNCMMTRLDTAMDNWAICTFISTFSLWSLNILIVILRFSSLRYDYPVKTCLKYASMQCVTVFLMYSWRFSHSLSTKDSLTVGSFHTDKHISPDTPSTCYFPLASESSTTTRVFSVSGWLTVTMSFFITSSSDRSITGMLRFERNGLLSLDDWWGGKEWVGDIEFHPVEEYIRRIWRWSWRMGWGW